MARPAFKRWWTQFVPPAIERSTYVLLSGLALILLYWQWQPMNTVIWRVENTAGFYASWALFWIGWVIVLLSTFLISYFDLFGLRQIYLYMKGQEHTHIALLNASYGDASDMRFKAAPDFTISCPSLFTIINDIS